MTNSGCGPTILGFVFGMAVSYGVIFLIFVVLKFPDWPVFSDDVRKSTEGLVMLSAITCLPIGGLIGATIGKEYWAKSQRKK